ncbi:hypothetical protein Tco_0946760 [Tanacetum coccineum]
MDHEAMVAQAIVNILFDLEDCEDKVMDFLHVEKCFCTRQFKKKRSRLEWYLVLKPSDDIDLRYNTSWLCHMAKGCQGSNDAHNEGHRE